MVTQRDPEMPFPSRSEYQRKLREAESAAQETAPPLQGEHGTPDSVTDRPAEFDQVGPTFVPPQAPQADVDPELLAEQEAFEAAERALEEASQRAAIEDMHAIATGFAPEEDKVDGDDASRAPQETFILEETRPYPPALLNQAYSALPRPAHSAPPARVFWEEPQASAPTPEAEAPADPVTTAPVPVAPAPAAAEENPLFTSLASPAAASASVPSETTGMRSRRLESERAKAKKRRLWRRVRTVITILLVLGLISGALWFAWTQIAGDGGVEDVDDYTGAGHGETQVTVFQGESGTDIGAKLVEAGVVKSTSAFIRAFEANQASANIWPGTYTLRLEMSAADALAALLDEANRSDNTVTVNPGQTLNQVVKKISEVTDISEADVNAALADTRALGLPDVAGGKIEGWLAPGSYEISANETPLSLLSQMIAARVKQLDDLKVPEADRQTLLIKASILEREVNIVEYLPKVARVIENRLADPSGETVGKLQMDSTVLYGVGKTGGIPNAEDLANDNPYNTYLHPGLPVAPIAQPSVEAIEAMMKPADGPWLYFVTIDLDTGETRFAPTKAEHDANKALLDAWCAANHPKCEQQ
ncbi:endolytic transglycosylase MltG [Schaalia sp. Marseille-Q2122]|uniref:endolytic transglycosylase MltG n=1 Tax=Schaalia sp. Marseille-Q2122 TaxID=2736604 RepID=UPI0020CA6337|nr:endolytic transglycosylase MltG [Schaalia sp. Marseille-Q2122]